MILCLSGTFSRRLGADELSVNGTSKTFKLQDVTAYTLPNGLKVLLYPDASKPDVTVNIVYKTGAKHENPGEYGLAHLLEHMLFKSTRQRAQIWQELEARGARFNANTNADRTSYYETLPASADNLEYAIALEADRMTGAVLDDAAIKAELTVVKNEWEQSGDSGFQPLLKEMLQVAYPHHAYGRDTLGIQEGLLQSKAETLRKFYQRHYGPNVAVLSIGGSFPLDEARRLIEKYFGPIPALKISEARTMLEPMAQQSERQVVMQRAAAASYVGLIYRAMHGADARFVAAQALVHCLGSGAQSVLQKELVRKGWAREAFGFVQQSAGEGFIAFIAKPAKGREPVQLVQRMAALLEKSSTSCTKTDLARFQTENSRAWAEMLRDSRSLAMQLAEYEVLGDWRLIGMEEDTGRQLQLSDLRDAARWIIGNNRTAGVLDNRAPSIQLPAAQGSGPQPMSRHNVQGKRMFKQP